ncbi:MAG TPA: acetyl-CoA hydrolase/transferase C-terminal domain-containing protein [Polyangia bacterium]|jgi:acetyl-CoA hydrolase
MSWIDTYMRKRVSPEDAVRVIKSGDTIYLQADTGVPQQLVRAMTARKDELTGVKVVHILAIGDLPYLQPGMETHFRHLALFTGANARKPVAEGRAEFIPIFLSEIPALFTKELPLDVALVHVSPPDEHGFCSFGTSINVTKPAAEAAKVVVAQVNANMPRSMGDSFIHVSKLDHVVEVADMLPELRPEPAGELYQTIAAHIAALIPDGATLQMGIGAIPDAVLPYLREKRDLGVHTEMFADGLMELLEEGVINNAKKTLHRGKVVASFFMGTRKLYDYVDNNPFFEFHPSHYTNDPFIIAQNDSMIAINSAIEVDLTGQVCADSMGYDIYSGIGGQVDFIRGAARSKGGKPIIALPSTAKGDAMTRIVPCLKPGAGVVTSRGDVHYVVTEYGVAYLHGKSIPQRVRALIDISHPKFREELSRVARERRWL